MGIEIEHKFRLTSYDTSMLRNGVEIEQGYLCLNPEIRVRIKGEKSFLTIKSEGTLVRKEFEYSIPSDDAKALLDMCDAKVEKRRYSVGRFEIDVFKGKLEGLVLLEVEVSKEDDAVTLPEGFVGVEVTADERFLNRHLARVRSVQELL